MNLIKKKKDFLQITQAETLTIREFDDKLLDNSISFPLGEMASLGALFSALPNAFSTIVQANNSGKVLYEAIFPVAGKLAQAKDGSGALGAIVQKGKGVVGQARFKEVQGVAQGAAGTSMMFMALAIMAVNKSLKDISENQKSIISFLEVDKESKLKGDLIVLSDIVEDYQHNWNNEQYRTNREMQILDIKRDAEQNILFFQEMIEKKTVCIEELTQLDNGFEAEYANVKEILSKDSASYKSEIEEMKKLISEITEKSMEVQLSEKRNEKLVYSKMSEERIKIRKSKNANKVASDYYKSMSGGNVVEPQFLDKKK